MLKAVRLVLLILGAGAAAWLVYQHAGTVAGALGNVGAAGFALYMAASFLVYTLDAWAWRLVFAKGQPAVSFGRLFSVRMAGEALNKVTPLASMGGEPLKAYLLTRDGATTQDALASVAVSKNVMTLAQTAFIFSGIALALPMHPGKAGLLLSLGVFPALVLTAIVVTAILDLRLRRLRKRGAVTAVTAGGSRIRSLFKGAADLWAQVADFFWAKPGAFALSFAAFYLGWAAAALELVAASWALGFPLSLRDAFILEALLSSVTMATFFVPAAAGTQEGGFALAAPLVGMTGAEGIALAVIRRCREAVWVIFGLAYLSLTEGRVLFRHRLDAPESAV